jgi:drug/metabolite transporter (DMT)-like permease
MKPALAVLNKISGVALTRYISKKAIQCTGTCFQYLYPVSYKLKLILAFAAIYLIWGSTFFGVQLALKSFPPFLLSALRLIIAGVALTVYCVFTRQKAPSLIDIGRHAVAGWVIFIGGVMFVVWAQQFISSSLASSVITTPFWFIILDRPQWKFYFSSKWILGGLLLSLAGVIVLMAFKQPTRSGSESETMQTIAILAMITGSFLWVAGSLYMRYRPSNTSIYVNTAIQLSSAGIVCLLLSYVTTDFDKFSMENVTPGSVFALVYLAIVSSLITFLAFQWLIRVQPPAVVSTYAYVNPLVATLLGWLLASEHISFAQIAALVIILTGVLFVNIPRYKASA